MYISLHCTVTFNVFKTSVFLLPVGVESVNEEQTITRRRNRRKGNIQNKMSKHFTLTMLD